MDQTVFFASLAGVSIISFLLGVAYQRWSDRKTDA